MKKILLGILTALMFLGCSSKDATEHAVEPKLVVEQSLKNLNLHDQFGTPHAIGSEIKKVVFAFSKDVGHSCNDFFATKGETYLQDNNAVFVADVSGAPSLIRSMFIMPGLKDFKHTILVIDDKALSNAYKPAQNSEKIIVVLLDNNTITEIQYLNSEDELSASLEVK
ncbi:hypothetical protein KKG72_12205 [bacterium]|nr:hypothetical protein [bacterium]MBU1993270.1 hypothetical protein [bacterium]